VGHNDRTQEARVLIFANAVVFSRGCGIVKSELNNVNLAMSSQVSVKFINISIYGKII
jgi:hypothetical protein